MGNNSSENYLDQLLNSMDGGDSSAANNDPFDETPEETIERELFGVDNSPETRRAKDEETFLREFEEELLKDDIPNHIDNLDKISETVPEAEDINPGTGMKESLDDMIDRVAKQMDDHHADVQEEPVVDENAEFAGELPESGLEQAVGAFDEKLEEESQPETRNTDELPHTDDGELDLSGMGDGDLLDMLSGDGELSDLGDMLKDEAEGNMLDGGDSIGDFAEAEMAEDKQQSEQEETKKGKKSKKNKKEKTEGGFFSKLSKVVFGEDEDDAGDKVEILENNGTDVSELSEENQQILAELETAGEEEDKKKKEKKKEKKKKEKKPKPKKPKKEKKPKPKKPKKEKKPKEVDKTPPLPKKPVIAIILMTASLFGFVMLTTNLLGYQTSITEAKNAFEEGDYVSAYQNIQGMGIKEKDENFYIKLSVLAAISEKYNSYLIFKNNGKYEMAIDSLICAYGRCDLNQKNAKEYEFEPELEELRGKVITTLLQEYDLTGDEALQLYQSKTRKIYTLKLREIIEKRGLEQSAS